jgi:hypothetical protein
MKGVITIFCLPQELEDLTLTLSELKKNSFYLNNKELKLKLDITLCLSDELIDWDKSILPKKYFDEKIKELLKAYIDWCEYDLYIEYSDKIIGCLSHRRNSWKKNPDADFFIWLDTDICFKDITLYSIINSFLTLKENGFDSFVITPQIVKQWDNTWDVLVNEKFINYPLNYQSNADIYSDIMSVDDEISIIESPIFKFAGGWFTLISKNLFDMVELPDSFGHYGPDDTFMMACCTFMKQKGYKVNQFIIENLLIGELYKYKINNTTRNFIFAKNRKDEFRKIAEDNFGKEYQQFLNKLNV